MHHANHFYGHANIMASYAGLVSHPFPTCFSCGVGRDPGDGLRIFPGRVSDVAAGDDGAPSARVAAILATMPTARVRPQAASFEIIGS